MSWQRSSLVHGAFLAAAMALATPMGVNAAPTPHTTPRGSPTSAQVVTPPTKMGSVPLGFNLPRVYVSSNINWRNEIARVIKYVIPNEKSTIIITTPNEHTANITHGISSGNKEQCTNGFKALFPQRAPAGLQKSWEESAQKLCKKDKSFEQSPTFMLGAGANVLRLIVTPHDVVPSIKSLTGLAAFAPHTIAMSFSHDALLYGRLWSLAHEVAHIRYSDEYRADAIAYDTVRHINSRLAERFEPAFRSLRAMYAITNNDEYANLAFMPQDVHSASQPPASALQAAWGNIRRAMNTPGSPSSGNPILDVLHNAQTLEEDQRFLPESLEGIYLHNLLGGLGVYQTPEGTQQPAVKRLEPPGWIPYQPTTPTVPTSNPRLSQARDATRSVS